MPEAATVVTETTPTQTQSTEQTQTSESTPQGPIHGNPAAEEARRALYEKHYGTTAPQTTEVAPTPTPTPAPAVTAPATSEPTVTTPAAPAQVTLPQEFLEAFTAMKAELAAIKGAVAPPPPPPPPVDPNAEPTWISLLREGKVKEAEDALVESVAKRQREDIAKTQQETVDQAVTRAREIARAEADVESFVKELRVANPDLSIMESFVTNDAQARLARVQASGSIKTTDDAVREYKKAVLDATESARKIAQQLRGVGKTEAMVRTKEVLSASTPTPQQIVQRQDTSAAPTGEQPAGDPVEEARKYLEARQQRETSLKNPYAR